MSRMARIRRTLHAFNSHGLLPVGDYVLTLGQLAKSRLVRGSPGKKRSRYWDAPWRAQLVENLSHLAAELEAVGIPEIFINGSFVEEKDHPNDIDGYFVCDRERFLSGGLERELKRVAAGAHWTWENDDRLPVPGHGWKLPMWVDYRVGTVSPFRAGNGDRGPIRERTDVPGRLPTLPHGGAERHCQTGEGIMIRTETEYQEARRRLKEGDRHMKAQQAELEKLDLSKAEIRRGMAPLVTFHDQLQEEVQRYERLRRGDKKELANLQELGQILIGLRIVSGLTQRQLAERLGVHESQVSRDERNDYHGVTIDRANRIIEALGFVLHYSLVPTQSRPATKDRLTSTR
jgi:DNA-binding XRE family transcriptional regulator